MLAVQGAAPLPWGRGSSNLLEYKSCEEQPKELGMLGAC